MKKDNIGTLVSFCGTMQGKCTAKVPLLDMLTSDDYAEDVMKIRAIYESEGKSDSYKEYKSYMPAFTPCGVWPIGSNLAESEIEEATGYLVVDLDQQDNPDVKDWNSLKKTLSYLSFIRFAALSISGHGLYLLIPIENPALYKEYNAAIQQAFRSMGLKTDVSNIGRRRVVSYDPDYYLAPAHLVRTWTLVPERVQAQPQRTDTENYKSQEEQFIEVEEKVRALEGFNRKHGPFEAVLDGNVKDSRTLWLQALTGLKVAFGEDGLTLADRISDLYEHRDKTSDMKTWRSLNLSKATLRSTHLYLNQLEDYFNR